MANPAGDLTTSDIIVETLIAWGATHVFGLVGDGIAGLIEAVRKREGQIQYVGVRHEEVAAFMASGYAKLTGNARKFDRRSCRLSVPQNQR
jgi:pyruvate dehydrogenase (quinone)